MEAHTVLIIRSQISVGGPGRLILSDINELKKRGYRVVLIVGSGSLIKAVEDTGSKCYVIDNISTIERVWYRNLNTLLQIRKIIKHEAIEAIIGYNTASTLYGYIASRCLRYKPVIINSLLGVGKEKYLNYMPFNHIVMSNTQKTNLIEKGVRAEKLIVVYPSTIDMDIYNPLNYTSNILKKTYSLSNDDILIGTVMSGPKASTFYAEAVISTLERHSNVYHFFVGASPDYKEIKKKLDASPYLGRFFFIDNVENIPQLMNDFDILSHLLSDKCFETFGMVITEAMIMCTPVVSSANGGPCEIIENGNTGYLVHSYEDYLCCISKLVANTSQRKAMALHARMRALEHFTVDKRINLLVDLLDGSS